MGIARQTHKPVVLVCTSGSAGYNFSPAVAEAFYQHIPLIVITADRPAEWIDQLDGQTIRQKHLYGEHVKRFFEFPQAITTDDEAWFANRLVNEAINLAQTEPRGPVHLNIPFTEPLYPTAQNKPDPPEPRVIERTTGTCALSDEQWSHILDAAGNHRKILVVPGQLDPDHGLTPLLNEFQARHRWPFAGDILSNLHGLANFCGHADTFLSQVPEKAKVSLKPDLLITFGDSLVAKNLKLFLRKFQPREHWHLQACGQPADTFQSLTKVIPVDPAHFFEQFNRRSSDHPLSQQVYGDEWMQHETQARHSMARFFASHDQGEFALVNGLMKALPRACNLHLANSMSVRYANHIGLSADQAGVRVYSNRGTSGIDGCTSTTAGHSLVSNVPNILITGDQAFFYDRNAFWHNYTLPNLSVVVLNNHGGIIFNLLDGPASQPEAEEYFVTRQTLRAQNLAEEFGFRYTAGMPDFSKDFFQHSGTVHIHELESSQSMNKSIFEAFRKQIKKSYET